MNIAFQSDGVAYHTDDLVAVDPMRSNTAGLYVTADCTKVFVVYRGRHTPPQVQRVKGQQLQALAKKVPHECLKKAADRHNPRGWLRPPFAPSTASFIPSRK